MNAISEKRNLLPVSILTKYQSRREVLHNEDGSVFRIEFDFDDRCGNEHNTFSIIGHWWETAEAFKRRLDYPDSCGFLSDLIEQYAPHFAEYLKWYGCSNDGPFNYLANTTYLAGDRDEYGHAAGEPIGFECGVRFDDVPVTHRVKNEFGEFLRERYGSGNFQVVAIAHERNPATYEPNYTLLGFERKWHRCPFRNRLAADEFCEAMNTCRVEFVTVPTRLSKGKLREFDAARKAAIWPEATANQLSLPKAELTKLLQDRLPSLMQEFKAAMEELGFVY